MNVNHAAARVCVVGGGPAGIMTGLLLARQGIDVVVLEKYADFLRDFRGDTIHPSTLDLLDDLGCLDEFLALPHDRLPRAQVAFGRHRVTIADFTRLPVRCRFIALVPQWEFLHFLAQHAAAHPSFELRQRAEVTDLLTEGGRVVGVRGTRDGAPFEVRADLVIGADGRHTVVRRAARLQPVGGPPPMDVLWFRAPRVAGERLPLFTAGHGALIALPRVDYWQLALAGPHGMAERLRQDGIGAFHRRVSMLRPELAQRVALVGWEGVHELAVRIDYLRRWHRPGVLCIGDAAHAMSPAGGVGINLAIQDAVATANLLGPILRAGPVTDDHLDAIRRRRLWPARLTQFAQRRIAVAIQRDRARDSIPIPIRVIQRVPMLRHLLGRIVGLGVRPERVRALDGARQPRRRGRAR